MLIPLHYKAFIDGENWFATINPATTVEGVVLYVYKKDWKGKEIPVSSKEYKTVRAAEYSLNKHYSKGEWKPYETRRQ